MEKYHKVAQELYRPGSARSIRCLAIWAEKRRWLKEQAFEKNILDKTHEWTQLENSLTGLATEQNDKNAIKAFGTAQRALAAAAYSGSAFDSTGAQLSAMNYYVDTFWAVAKIMGKQSLAQKQAN